MLRYLFRRVIAGLITLFIFATFIFFASQYLVPGDFATQYTLFLSPAELAALRQRLGLDLPVGIQYFNWLRNLLLGSGGTSFTGRPVMDILGRVLPTTVLIFFTGTGIAFLFGLWLGKFMAWRRRGLLTFGATSGAILLHTSFPPWLAFLVVHYLVRRFNILTNYYQDWRWRNTDLHPEIVTWYLIYTLVGVLFALLVIDWLVQRRWRRGLPAWVSVPLGIAAWVGSWYAFGFGVQGVDVLSMSVLPILTYVLLSFGEIALIMRTSMDDTLDEDYIWTARAKGLSETRIRDRHAARNALLPVLSRMFISLPYLLSGLVIIEYAIDRSGLGGTLFQSLINQDMPVLMVSLLLIGVVSLGARLVLDVLHAALDPRIRYGQTDADVRG